MKVVVALALPKWEEKKKEQEEEEKRSIGRSIESVATNSLVVAAVAPVALDVHQELEAETKEITKGVTITNKKECPDEMNE